MRLQHRLRGALPGFCRGAAKSGTSLHPNYMKEEVKQKETDLCGCRTAESRPFSVRQSDRKFQPALIQKPFPETVVPGRQLLRRFSVHDRLSGRNDVISTYKTNANILNCLRLAPGKPRIAVDFHGALFPLQYHHNTFLRKKQYFATESNIS